MIFSKALSLLWTDGSQIQPLTFMDCSAPQGTVFLSLPISVCIRISSAVPIVASPTKTSTNKRTSSRVSPLIFSISSRKWVSNIPPQFSSSMMQIVALKTCTEVTIRIMLDEVLWIFNKLFTATPDCLIEQVEWRTSKGDARVTPRYIFALQMYS